MIESVQAQTYTKWELCLADGSGRGTASSLLSGNILQKINGLKLPLDSNEGIAGNTNEALKMADR